MAWGVRVQLTLLPALLPALAVKKLARLPLTFSDPLGQPVRLHAESVLTYADVALSVAAIWCCAAAPLSPPSPAKRPSRGMFN
ncbi:propanediol utilization protein PduM [Klebsiella pneumoniae]|uniref:Propanediol utilization protein PduM n=1 Tax=Klebsiella pneumoniae TaxID=573 RepID=A0A377WRG5_KLEPN|nr:propanediol utilization protein PduM [Klebsiella pneumoniae]